MSHNYPPHAPLPSSVDFTLEDGTVLTAKVHTHPRARWIRLTLDGMGNLQISVPHNLPPQQLEAHLPDFLPSLERAWKKHPPKLPKAELPDSIAVPLLHETFTLHRNGDPTGENWHGSNMNLRRGTLIHGQDDTHIWVAEGPGHLHLMGDTSDIRLCARALQCWCRLVATTVLPVKLTRLAKREGFAVQRVSVRDQHTRWGSCSRGSASPKGGFINLNWRALLLPVPVLEHLFRHELCHLRHMNHSAEYYAELAHFAPDWTEQEQALHSAWRTLPWWTLPCNGPASPPPR